MFEIVTPPSMAVKYGFNEVVIMALAAKIIKRTKDSFEFRISKESFCDSTGLYRREFLEALDSSEKDHRAGRVTKQSRSGS